ncbi:hypothetical protein TIFTF001_053948 [Ficus carica]|uniref:Uncharacterized protein n=1 Tax=Ficus carica TaxID=3494 RepID=A0AA88EH92_FICCA|nr:hypothetical protein TIFTF001_053945 [Ficus carica]GMN74927.1 hypothetical protein TIFTF001_053946 [Ficus carica]GMN74929.1 hypothetical protein TIFTF001_053947 [Ficus carica]GMN74934.1 hypothetical protein TIFTF001_053948 [Ficus carica]
MFGKPVQAGFFEFSSNSTCLGRQSNLSLPLNRCTVYPTGFTVHLVFPTTLMFTRALAPVHPSRVPPHQCPCAAVSLYHLAFGFAHPREADEASIGDLEPKTNPKADYPLFSSSGIFSATR